MDLVPLTPSGFNITGEIYTNTNLTLAFEWDGPQGSGPQAIVDAYIIAIAPGSLSPSGINMLPNSPQIFNVTLNYNTSYTAAIAAVNCAGESTTFVYPANIEYGTKLEEIMTITS